MHVYNIKKNLQILQHIIVVVTLVIINQIKQMFIISRNVLIKNWLKKPIDMQWIIIIHEKRTYPKIYVFVCFKKIFFV